VSSNRPGDVVERDDPEAPAAAAALYGSNTMSS
jgi:hypothetical protein